jgi:GDPmannose 4,6-dehydratase
VLATGETHTVREFVERAFKVIGLSIGWRGEAEKEEGFDSANPSRVVVRVDEAYYRPTEVDLLLGDPTKAKTVLGWVAKTSFPDLVEEMVKADINLVEKGDLWS